MSYIIRRAATQRPLLRSIPCNRTAPPVIISSAIPLARRHYAAHQAEESYDAFNERYISLPPSGIPRMDGIWAIG